MLNKQIFLVEKKLLTACKKSGSCGSRSFHLDVLVSFELGLWFWAECVCTGQSSKHISCKQCVTELMLRLTRLFLYNVVLVTLYETKIIRLTFI